MVPPGIPGNLNIHRYPWDPAPPPLPGIPGNLNIQGIARACKSVRKLSRVCKGMQGLVCEGLQGACKDLQNACKYLQGFLILWTAFFFGWWHSNCLLIDTHGRLVFILIRRHRCRVLMFLVTPGVLTNTLHSQADRSELWTGLFLYVI